MKLTLMLGLAIAWAAMAQAAEPIPEPPPEPLAESLPGSLAKKLLGGSTITIYPLKAEPLQLEKEKGCGIKRECFDVQYGDGAMKRECYVIKDCHM